MARLPRGITLTSLGAAGGKAYFRVRLSLWWIARELARMIAGEIRAGRLDVAIVLFGRHLRITWLLLPWLLFRCLREVQR